MSRKSLDVAEKPVETSSKPDDHAKIFEYPSNRKRMVVMAAVYLAVFLVTLDQNIISTALPRITDEFHSIDDISWYGTAYLLTLCSLQLVMGRVYKFYPVKPIFLAHCLLFEVGSAVCGAAPTSNAFIAGRAISGLGAAGLFSGVMVILFHTVPLQQRPTYQGLFGAVFAIGSVIGPLIGGTLTDKVTWRWCFYINLPIGAVSMIVTMFILRLPNQKLDQPADGVVGKAKQLDPIGNLVFLPGIISLVLALQWAGTKYAWDSARIIVLFVLFGIFSLLFVGVQAWKGEGAILPPRIVKQRSVAAAAWYGFFNGGGMTVLTYYLPIWFQAIKNVDAIKSGIMLLPFILTAVMGALFSGALTSRLGYYTPFFYVSSIIMPIGAGLLTTFTPSTGHAKWISYQVLTGIGLGVGMQQPLNVVQTVLDRPDIATGSAFIMFARFMGAAVFLPVAQTIFLNSLVSDLDNLPGIDPKSVTGQGVTDLRKLASGADLSTLLSDYNSAIIDVFYLVVAMFAVTVFGSIFIEWRSLKARAAEQAGKKPAGTAELTTEAA